MSHLADENCAALSGSEYKLPQSAIDLLMPQLSKWTVDDQSRLSRRFAFDNFVDALSFTNALADIAEAQGHHPDLELGWGYVVVNLSTHDVGGLSRNDFIVAARIDQLAS